MKKLSTVSLFIFGVVLIAILTAGLVFYQNNKYQNQTRNQVRSIIDTVPAGEFITLDMKEISKHNTQSNCWLLISGKVYNVTTYFGSHPGGNGSILSTCGTDATVAYATRDSNATSVKGGNSHSSNALKMLTSYYIGNLNQSIGQQKITETNAIPAPLNKGDDDDDEWDD